MVLVSGLTQANVTSSVVAANNVTSSFSYLGKKLGYDSAFSQLQLLMMKLFKITFTKANLVNSTYAQI